MRLTPAPPTPAPSPPGGGAFCCAIRTRATGVANLELEGESREHCARPNARLRDDPEAAQPPEGDGGPQGRSQIKRMKLMDLEFANEVLTAEGETVDKSAPKRWRADAAAEKAEAFRKSRL